MKIFDFKKYIWMLIFIPAVNFAQVKTSIDTTRIFNFAIPEEVLELQLSTELSFGNQQFHFSASMLRDTSNVWLRTRMMMTGINMEDNPLGNNTSSMLNPLYNKYMESQKLATLRTILGSLQVGAVSYLAYKHIKKYGFLKKK